MGLPMGTRGGPTVGAGQAPAVTWSPQHKGYINTANGTPAVQVAAPVAVPAPAPATQTPAPEPQQQGPDPKFDLTQPGWGEQYWEANKDTFAGNNNLQEAAGAYDHLFKTPTASEQLWAQSGGPMENRSDAEYDRFDSSGPNFGAYYDNAYTRGSNKLNQELAARGQYGSSMGMQSLTDLGVGLNAERANRESDFMAQRQRDRIAAAGQADSVDLRNLLGRGQLAGAASSDALSRAEGGIGLGNLLDSRELQDFSTGMSAATGAQGLREGRIRGGYQDLLSMGNATAPKVQSSYDDLFSGDQEMLENILEMKLGIPREQINQLMADRAENTQTAGTIMKMIGSFFGGGMGGMGG